MNESKKYNVTILGEVYSIVSDESEDHVKQSAELVNTLMKEISEKSKLLDIKKVAVLAALCVASKTKHLQAELETSTGKQEQLGSLIEEALLSTCPSSVF